MLHSESMETLGAVETLGVVRLVPPRGVCRWAEVGAVERTSPRSDTFWKQQQQDLFLKREVGFRDKHKSSMSSHLVVVMVVRRTL